MGQFNWTYIGDQGKNYNIGLYHGDESGHVLVYVNKSLLIIDFSILEAKKYSFYLGEQLCDLSIEPEESSFSYDLKVNEEVLTALNVSRKKTRNKHYLWSALVLVGIILLVAIIAYSINKHL